MDLQRCSVFAVLCQRGIPEEYAINITCETLKALIYLHSKGFIHRDVKCENLLLGWNGEVKLADFGLATRTNKRNRDRLGTSKWMAPEVIREQYYDEKIDMWSLGITIIEMMDRSLPTTLSRMKLSYSPLFSVNQAQHSLTAIQLCICVVLSPGCLMKFHKHDLQPKKFLLRLMPMFKAVF